MRIPKSLGTKIDMVSKIRDERLKLEASAKDFKKQEAALSGLIVGMLQKAGVTKSTATLATFSFKSVRIGKVTDWAKLYGYIKKSNNFDLLERRVAQGSYREHLENGDKMPGLEMDSVIKTSLTRI